MKLRIDPDITYALALEGGGAKGAYQIGAWRALREAGIRIGAVAGTSVGALNGVLITMGDLPRAEEIWNHIHYSQVMDVDDETMRKLIAGDIRQLDLRTVGSQLFGLLKNRGLDVSPLYNWIQQVVSEPLVRSSDTELYIVTYSLDDQKELELRAKDLPEGSIVDMLLASAYLPVFRNEKLGGKRYADGGVRDVLPLHVLLQNGYRNIIALRLGTSAGLERHVRIPRATTVHTISPTEDLGGLLEFEAELSRKNMRTGYFDTLRFLYGLRGNEWYIDCDWTEDDAYAFLAKQLRAALDTPQARLSSRKLNEKILPALEKKLDAPGTSYIDTALVLLETLAARAGLEQWKVYTAQELAAQLSERDNGALLTRQLCALLPDKLLPKHLPAVLPHAERDLKICLMNDSFPPTLDGVANVVQNYAQLITEHHGSCAVVTPEYPGVTDDYPYPVIRYPSLNTTKLAGYRAGNPLAPDTVETLSHMDFSLIHTHCPVSSAVLACSLREVINAPVVLTYHTKFDIDINRTIKNELLQAAALKLLVSNISACDDVWVVSRGAGENLRALGYTGEYTLMPNGVDLPRGRVDERICQALDVQWSLPRDVPVYLFVGRMMWYKNLQLILDALARLAPTQAFCMVFVGDGQDKKAVQAYADKLGLSGRCRFVGAISDREALRAWYCRADLQLFVSTFDTNGLVVREAAACSLGSVLVRGSCAAEGITDGRNGVLVEETPDALCAALQAVTLPFCRQLGACAMRELYLSWAQSVEAAWARYEIISERWKRGELHKPKTALEGLYDVSGDVLQTLGQAKKQRQAVWAQLSKEFARMRDKLER